MHSQLRVTPNVYRPELQVCTATRSPCEDQALPLRGPLPLVPRAVSPHRGNLVAGYISLYNI